MNVQVELAFRLRDANGRVTIGRITLFVYSRPSVDKFCAYDVRPQDTLSSVSDAFGMHWLTLFLLNNHTIRHPDRLVLRLVPVACAQPACRPALPCSKFGTSGGAPV